MDVPPIIQRYGEQSPDVPPKLSDVPLIHPQAPPLAAMPTVSENARKSASSRPVTGSKPLKYFALFMGIGLVLLLGAGVYLEKIVCSPKHSVLALGEAIQRGDRETVAEYIDAPALAESMQKYTFAVYKRNEAKTVTNFTARLFAPLIDSLAQQIGSVTCTPDSVIGILCGDDPKDAMKEGIGKSSDNAVDAFTKDGTPKEKIYGAVSKGLIRWVAAMAIDEATRENQDQKSETNPDDYSVSGQYETSGRYLIKFTSRNSDDPSFGWGFKRHGLATWRLTEIRLLPQRSNQSLVTR